ncbi:unnamed protein product [Boreogadus saida]
MDGQPDMVPSLCYGDEWQKRRRSYSGEVFKAMTVMMKTTAWGEEVSQEGIIQIFSLTPGDSFDKVEWLL